MAEAQVEGLSEERRVDLMLLLVDLQALEMGLGPAAEALALLMADLQVLDLVLLPLPHLHPMFVAWMV